MKYIVDRVEQEIVVAIEQDTNKIIKIDKSLIGFNAFDGLVINYKNGIYSEDLEETKRLKEKTRKRFDKLKEID